MREYLPILIIGAIIGVFALVFIIAYAMMKDKKEAIGFDRNMKDSEILVRMMKYVKPYLPYFILAPVLMVVEVVGEVVMPKL